MTISPVQLLCLICGIILISAGSYHRGLDEGRRQSLTIIKSFNAGYTAGRI